MTKQQHILIIGFVWPEPGSSAAGSRMMQLIGLFQQQEWKITFASAAADSEYMVDLQSIGVEKIAIELNNSSFNSFIQKLQPSIILFDRFMIEEQFGWRVAEHCPGAMRIIDTEDLHCLRAARQKAFKENRIFINDDLLSEEVAKREIASILRSDLSLIISGFEMNLLKNLFHIDSSLIYQLPFMSAAIDELVISKWKPFENREHFITIGNFLHEPNRNAVLFLKEEIWPLIRKELPQAELHIYGAYPSQKINQLHHPETGFHIMGRAKDAKEVIANARVSLAPLRFGAGIKGKLVESMACGTPGVTTSVGAEAMHGELPWNGIIADNAKEIAIAAIELYTNKTVWQQAQQNGIAIINTLYADTLPAQELIKRIIHIQNNLEQHRINNFTGSMLMHHTAASTKYMSRWIETKNANSSLI